MNIGSEDERIIQLLQNLDFTVLFQRFIGFMTVFKEGQILNAHITYKCWYNTLTSCIYRWDWGTKSQEQRRHWEPKRPGGRRVRTGATQSTCSSTQVKFNFGDQTRLCCWPITSRLIGRRAGGSKTEEAAASSLWRRDDVTQLTHCGRARSEHLIRTVCVLQESRTSCQSSD